MTNDCLPNSKGDPEVASPSRQIRAVFSNTTITVYQAYCHDIAERALQAQRFMPPFQFDRMTWIKPSFLWMMYRSGWGIKKGQERILAIEITRSGLQWCLDNACLSCFDPSIHITQSAWQQAKEQSPVRVQWDPERSIRLVRLNHRSIQIGLGGLAIERYVGKWITQIQDVTSLAHEIHRLVQSGQEETAAKLVPREIHYHAVARHLGLHG